MYCPNPACARWLKTGKDGVKAHLMSRSDCLPHYVNVRWTRAEHDDLRNNIAWWIAQGDLVGDIPPEQTEFSPDDAPAPTAIVVVAQNRPASAFARGHQGGLAGQFEDLSNEFRSFRRLFSQLEVRVDELQRVARNFTNDRSRSPPGMRFMRR